MRGTTLHRFFERVAILVLRACHLRLDHQRLVAKAVGDERGSSLGSSTSAFWHRVIVQPEYQPCSTLVAQHESKLGKR
jgi:hypothetical protein